MAEMKILELIEPDISMTYNEKFKDNERLSALVLAHKNLQQLHRLIQSLKHDKVDIFIHLDKKWKLSKVEIDSITSTADGHVYICDSRISASLDTWSLVEATLELIRKSKQIEKEVGVRYKYSLLLSAQDYPIKPMDLVYAYLELSYPKPFIDCTPYDKENWIFHKFNKLPLEISINRYINSHMNRGVLRKLAKIPFYVFFRLLKIFHTTYDDLKRAGLDLYGGSAWWILPDVAIEDLLQKCSDENNLSLNILKKSHTPEETFFQIMVMQSPVKDLVDINSKEMIAQNSMTFAYFSDTDKPFKGHPYILTAKNFDMLCHLPHFFARKFDFSVDSHIFDLIDSKLIHKIERVE